MLVQTQTQHSSFPEEVGGAGPGLTAAHCPIARTRHPYQTVPGLVAKQTGKRIATKKKAQFSSGLPPFPGLPRYLCHPVSVYMAGVHGASICPKDRSLQTDAALP